MSQPLQVLVGTAVHELMVVVDVLALGLVANRLFATYEDRGKTNTEAGVALCRKGNSQWALLFRWPLPAKVYEKIKQQAPNVRALTADQFRSDIDWLA